MSKRLIFEQWYKTSMYKNKGKVVWLFRGNWDKISMDKNMIIINKNNLCARPVAPNGCFYIIFLYFYPLIFYTQGGPERGKNCPIFPIMERKRKMLLQRIESQ